MCLLRPTLSSEGMPETIRLAFSLPCPINDRICWAVPAAMLQKLKIAHPNSLTCFLPCHKVLNFNKNATSVHWLRENALRGEFGKAWLGASQLSCSMYYHGKYKLQSVRLNCCAFQLVLSVIVQLPYALRSSCVWREREFFFHCMKTMNILHTKIKQIYSSTSHSLWPL